MQGSIAQSYFVYDQVEFGTARNIFYNFKSDHKDQVDEFGTVRNIFEDIGNDDNI